MKTLKKLLVVGCMMTMLPMGETQTTSLPQTPDILTQALRQEIEFDRYWGLYLLTKVGCSVQPDGSVVRSLTSRDCQNQPQIDAGSYYKARELAKKVFKLHD